MSDEELAVKQKPQEDAPVANEEQSEEEALKAKLKEAISVESEEVGALRQKLTITIPQEVIAERMGKEFLDLKREAEVPGFRKGHAPLKLVEKRFGSDVGDQLVNQLVSNGYLAAIDKEEINALGDPQFWIDVEERRGGDKDDGGDASGKGRMVNVPKLLSLTDALEHIKIPTEGALTFCCEVELKPDFELPELKNIPVERTKTTVDDAEITQEIDRLLMYRGTFQPVEKGAVEADDMLYADMKMSVDGVEIVSEQNIDIAARDIVLNGVRLQGLGDVLVGKKTGDAASMEATVPDDHKDIDLRGKKASFEFKINEIKRLVLPKIDEEFLAGSGFDSEEELRTTIRTTLESRRAENERRSAHDQIGNYLVDNTKLEIPEGLSQRQTERSLDRNKMRMYQMGVPEAEVAKRTDEMRTDARDQVVRDLKLHFVLEKIAEDRDIDVPEERLNMAIAQIAQRGNKRFDRVRDELSKSDGLVTLYLQIRDEMLMDELLEDAALTDADESPKKKVVKKKAAKKAPAGKVEKTAEKTVKTAVKKTAKKGAKKKKVAK